MATVPVTRAWVAGEVVTAGYMNNNITSVLGWLLAPAICRVRATGAQSIANNTFATLTFDAEDLDSTGMHSTSVNTSRITAVYPGWYFSAGANCWAAGGGAATSRRLSQHLVNAGSALNGSIGGGVGMNSIMPAVWRSMHIYLNVGDYVETQIYQDTGSSLSTYVALSNYQPSWDVRWSSN